MKKKKIAFKTIMFIVFLLVFILIVSGTCKRKVNAFDYSFYDTKYYISERDQEALGFSSYFALVPATNTETIYYISTDYTNDYFYIDYYYNNNNNYYYMYLNLYQDGQYISCGSTSFTSPFVIISITKYNNELYLLIDNVEYESISTGQNQVDYNTITRVYIEALEDYGFLDVYYDNEIYIQISRNGSFSSQCLLQSLYIQSGDTLNTIYNAFDDCVNYDYLSYWLQYGYTSGYDAGETAGELSGYNSGYNAGYNAGYTAGQNGENATPLIFAVLTGVFETIGAFLSIEVLPHIPIGLFFALPLFFAVVGLILWIWRRN